MFQGSENLGKMEFIKLVQSNGGVLNGSTRFDFTNYFEIVPANTLETVLWAEADRMRGLAITEENLKNQQGVVKNEVRVNVLNQPYGGFPWLDMPQYANTNWYNAHNFYGDLKDLDAATLEDVAELLQDLLRPEQRRRSSSSATSSRRRRSPGSRSTSARSPPRQPPRPDISEPRQEKEKRATKHDSARAPGRRWPSPITCRDRKTPEYYAMGLLDQILAPGQGQPALPGAGAEARPHRRRRRRHQPDLGNMFNINGPTLWTTSLFHDTRQDRPTRS